MKTQIILLFAMFWGINNAYSQKASFTYRIDSKKVTTTNTSNFTRTPTDSFAANWVFVGDGNLLFENFDSASFDFFTGGNYMVILTLNHFIKGPNNPNTWTRKQDTIQSITTVSVSATNVFNISGNVKWKGSNINNGNVHLLKKNGNNYVSVRFSPINEAGNYSFSNLTRDTFIVWAQPIICDTCLLTSSNVIPTYYGNSDKIDSAVKIIPTNNLTNINIDFKEPAELNGILKLTGKVSNGSNFVGNTSLLLYSTDKSKTFRYSVSNNSNGGYLLEKIEAGNYLLQPIVNGLPYSPLSISIAVDNSVIDVDLSTLTTSVEEQRFDNNGLFSIYPNPFSDKITINQKNQSKLKSVSVSNLQGQLLFKSEIFDTNELDLSELNSGLYFVTINNTNGKSNTIKIIKN